MSGWVLDNWNIRVLFFEYIVVMCIFAVLVAICMKQQGTPEDNEAKEIERVEGVEAVIVDGELEAAPTKGTELEVIHFEEEVEDNKKGGGEEEGDLNGGKEEALLTNGEEKTMEIQHPQHNHQKHNGETIEKNSEVVKEGEEREKELLPLPSSSTTTPSPTTTTPPASFQQKLLLLLFNRSLILFLVSVFIMGMGAAIIQNFLFLYLKTSLGASKTLMGLSLTFTGTSKYTSPPTQHFFFSHTHYILSSLSLSLLLVLVEIPFFFFSKYLLEKLGMRGMVVLAHVCYIIRVVAYTMLPNAWAVLPFELLHGTTFAAMWYVLQQQSLNSHFSVLLSLSLPRPPPPQQQGCRSGLFKFKG